MFRQPLGVKLPPSHSHSLTEQQLSVELKDGSLAYRDSVLIPPVKLDEGDGASSLVTDDDVTDM